MRSGRAGAFFLMTEREQDHIFLPLVGGCFLFTSSVWYTAFFIALRPLVVAKSAMLQPGLDRRPKPGYPRASLLLLSAKSHAALRLLAYKCARCGSACYQLFAGMLPPERDEGNTSERAQWAMQRGFVGAAVKTGSGDSRARRFWVPQEVPRGTLSMGSPLESPPSRPKASFLPPERTHPRV